MDQPAAVRGRVDALWHIEGARIVAALARVTGDVGLAEDAAQDAVADALVAWSRTGIPRNPGAWITTVAKRRAIDRWRRAGLLQDRYELLARGIQDEAAPEWDPLPDDVLRLLFTACHPVLSTEAQIALTLRVVGSLSTEEIARLFLVPVATVQQRIVRSRKTLAAARVPFEPPEPNEWTPRLRGVLHVIYLMFTEGYAATTGETWTRPALAAEALRIGRILTGLIPRVPEAHALVALMEFSASRFAARSGPDGGPVLLADQDRTRWDRAQIERGRASLARADRLAGGLGRARGSYALQAAIAECHATAARADDTDWPRIVVLYEALARISPGPVVELNRAVAVSMATGPEAGLAIVNGLEGTLSGSHLLPSVRAELLARLGRTDEARAEFTTAARLAKNLREREVLQRRAASL
ncbi:DUF6596 domain-containing protein [Arthrobacter sp. zg-Y877]|uniref:RNA polymerase sigma factor n=1 Tax=Arthrobacter sp. zg-Y877 TaxID=3049074 RepID=UPI0025A4B4EC|nr:DUF6596 domain-containing protein [Arthrobacter sp. zg-Y877]MDM7989327.1 sigma factor-like helix-turn-helix DNA-binding protein [Arthrobacter sp. zg-Y877]